MPSFFCFPRFVQIHFYPKTFDHTGLPEVARPEPYLALSPTSRKLVILDSHGKIFYDTNIIMDSSLVAVLGENVSEAYLAHLRENDISYLFAGADGHDLEKAMNQIGELFRIEQIVLEGGGIVNGQFFKHGLIDEFSLMIYPGIDGLAGVHSIIEYSRTKPQTHLRRQTGKRHHLALLPRSPEKHGQFMNLFHSLSKGKTNWRICISHTIVFR